MRSIFILAIAVIVGGCSGGIKSYEDGVKAQMRVMEQMVAVLEDVDDETSAEKAAARIEELGTELAEIYSAIRELPKPSSEEMQRVHQKYAEEQKDFQMRAAAQMQKLAQYQSLLEAWTKAMSKMK